MTTIPTLPIPTDALTVGDWRTSDGEEWRQFKGASRPLEHCGGPVELNICGEQYTDRIERFVTISDYCLDVEHLALWARALLAVRDEIQQQEKSK